MSTHLALPNHHHQSENRPKTGRKAPRTAFVLADGGNPGGRPKKTEEEFQLIHACQQKALEALAQIDKSIPDLKSIEHCANDESPIQRRMNVEFVAPKQSESDR